MIKTPTAVALVALAMSGVVVGCAGSSGSSPSTNSVSPPTSTSATASASPPAVPPIPENLTRAQAAWLRPKLKATPGVDGFTYDASKGVEWVYPTASVTKKQRERIQHLLAQATAK